jgi:hypothetical protein
MDEVKIRREVRDTLFVREGRGKISLLEVFQPFSARPSDRGRMNFQTSDFLRNSV